MAGSIKTSGILQFQELEVDKKTFHTRLAKVAKNLDFFFLLSWLKASETLIFYPRRFAKIDPCMTLTLKQILNLVRKRVSQLCYKISLGIRTDDPEHCSTNCSSILYPIDLFRVYILFSQYRSCDDTQEI